MKDRFGAVDLGSKTTLNLVMIVKMVTTRDLINTMAMTSMMIDPVTMTLSHLTTSGFKTMDTKFSVSNTKVEMLEVRCGHPG